jgi:3-hydroxyisobutyrate dehydrogenase-like beta-hydroxyacid dehydrogenase
MTTMTLLHPGSMGAAIGGEAVRGGTRVLWVPQGRSEATRRRAGQAGLEAAGSLAEALAVSDVVLSVCPAHGAEAVAEEAARLPCAGVYVEANPTAPDRLARIAGRFSPRPVVDACVFGPDSGRTRVARLYVADRQDALRLLQEIFAGTRVDVRPTTGGFGSASALKLAFSTYQRGARVLSALAYALAEHHGVTAEALAEAQDMPRADLTDPGFIRTLAARSWRWRHELDEVARALDAAGLPPGVAVATAELMTRWEPLKDTSVESPAEALAYLRDTKDAG